ncbi:hypothetical protein D3C84_845490 [compost metagenome]
MLGQFAAARRRLQKWDAGQQVAVTVAADLGQLPLRLVGGVLPLGFFALQAVRAHQPEIATGTGQALYVHLFKVGSIVRRRSRKLEIVTQRERLMLAVSAYAMFVVGKAREPLQTDGFVVRHPQRVADL